MLVIIIAAATTPTPTTVIATRKGKQPEVGEFVLLKAVGLSV